MSKNFKEIKADYELNYEESVIHLPNGKEKIMVPVVPEEELKFA